MSSRPELRLDWCSHEAAKYAVEKWHYSGTLPMPPVVRVGVWESLQFIGCVLFSRGASPNLGKPYGLSVTEVCELTRVALGKHATPVSRVLSIATKLLRRREAGLRLIVSFADSNENHYGGIYQANGWIYLGRTAEKCDYIGPDGKRYRDRQVTSSGYAKQFGKMTKVFKVSECKPVPLAGKHRYAMPLDPEMRAKILSLAKPYPKRATSIASDAPANHAGEGGATPTVALSKSKRANKR